MYGDSVSKPSSSSAMLQRCNLHSTMVLRALHTSTSHTYPSSHSSAIGGDTGEQDTVSIKLRPSQLTRDQVTTGTSMYPLLSELSQWNPHTMDSSCSQSAVSHMMPGGGLMTSSSGCGQNSLTHDQREMVFRHTTAVSELLRHFWSCFPARTPQLEEKVGGAL